MEEKHKRRYLLAVYLIVALVAIVMLIVGGYYYPNTGTIHDLLINLASDLMGVVLLFIIVDQVFLINQDRDIYIKLNNIVSTFERKFAILDTEDEILKRIMFPNRLNSARSFFLLALDASGVLKSYHQKIIASVIDGAKVQLLLLSPKSDAAKVFNAHISAAYGGNLYDYSRIVDVMFNKLKNSQHSVLGSLEVRVTDWVPSCRIMAFDADSENGAMMVNIYPVSFYEPRYKNRLSIFLTPTTEPYWYKYFYSEYMNLWNAATTWNDFVKRSG